MEVCPKCNIRPVQLFAATNSSEHFGECGVCLADGILTILRQWQAGLVSSMGRWLSCKDIWEAIYEKVLYQGGVDPDVLSENWTRWFFRHAFHKHSDYCYELKP